MDVTDYGGWMGTNPFYLMIALEDENVGIDLDQTGWATTFADKLRLPGQWILIHKESGHQALIVKVNEGDQGYYTARHVGIAGSAGSNEVTAYGIGKKCADGHVERLWILPGGTVCAGDDVDQLGVMMVQRMGPRPYPEE